VRIERVKLQATVTQVNGAGGLFDLLYYANGAEPLFLLQVSESPSLSQKNALMSTRREDVVIQSCSIFRDPLSLHATKVWL
jgi:hypothetical protein